MRLNSPWVSASERVSECKALLACINYEIQNIEQVSFEMGDNSCQ